jgi:hypothetical protein
MSALPEFDIDAIMRDVRAAAKLAPATTATLLQERPNRSRVAIVAAYRGVEVEERAGLAADSVPAVYLDAWARLNCQKPFLVREGEWRLALDDGGQFLDAWGNKAAKMGWTPGELFDRPSGLVWRLAGERVVAMSEDSARVSSGRFSSSDAARPGGRSTG